MMDAAAQDQLPPRQAEAPIRPGTDICFITCCTILSVFVTTIIFFCGIYFLLDQILGQVPHYSVAIDSVSRLDPVFAGRPKLDLEFNLTLRVASQGFWVRECADPGMHVEVSYHGVWLASSMPTTEQICAGPRMAVDRPVVARGAGVVVLGTVLDSLAEDMHSEVQVFEVELHGWGKNASWTCGPRRVGDGYLLQMDCTK
ncbi:unnamed protein product [Alopecurus aequalis]